MLEMHHDSWANLFNGVGMPGKDSRLGWMPYTPRKSVAQLRNLWVGDGIAGRIVELPADTMTQERGVVTLGDGLAAQEKRLTSDLDTLATWARLRKAVTYARAYGGGGIVMAVDDGLPWHMPVDESRIRKVKALHPANPDELYAERWYKEKEHEDYGKPSLYRWTPDSLPGTDVGGMTNSLVHASRVLRFQGIDVDNRELAQNRGWGHSVIARCEQLIRDTAGALNGTAVLLQSFSQAVLGILDLNSLLGDKQGKEKLRVRLEGMRMAQSALGVLVIDSKETFKREPTPMGGIPDALQQFAYFLSAITGIPVTVLMGQAPAGLNATGESDINTWHQWVQSRQDNDLRPELNKLIRLILLSAEGPTRGVEPPDWMLKFNPLRRLTQKESAELEKLEAETDETRTRSQVVLPEEIAAAKYKPGNPTGIVADMTLRAALPPPAEEPTPTPALPLPAEPAPAPAPQPTPAPAEPTPVPEAPVEEVQKTAFNGAQIKSMAELVAMVVKGDIPRDSGVEQLALGFNITTAEAERVMGSAGKKPPAAPNVMAPQQAQPLAPTADSMGRRRLILRPGRADAVATNFPVEGDNKPVSIANSVHGVFDVRYAEDLRQNWPEIWALSTSPLGNTQYQRLVVLARGEVADTPGEEHAIRLREAWAHEKRERTTLSGVVAQVKWLVVGTLGMEGMKALIEKEKDRVRARRQEAAR